MKGGWWTYLPIAGSHHDVALHEMGLDRQSHQEIDMGLGL